MRFLAALALLLVWRQNVRGQETVTLGGNADLIEITAYAIRHEADASQLKGRKDLCVAIDTRLSLHEKDLYPS